MSQKKLKKDKDGLIPESFDPCLKMLQRLEREGLIFPAKPGDPDYEEHRRDHSTKIVFSSRRT